MGAGSWGQGSSWGFKLCQGVPSCVTGPADPGPGHGLGFLTGLGLTTRHPPYVKLVVSFLFISAAVQVLRRLTPPWPRRPHGGSGC